MVDIVRFVFFINTPSDFARFAMVLLSFSYVFVSAAKWAVMFYMFVAFVVPFLCCRNHWAFTIYALFVHFLLDKWTKPCDIYIVYSDEGKTYTHL